MGRCEGILGKEGVSIIFGGIVRFRVSFCVEGIFSGDGVSSPRGKFICIPVFGSAVERSTLYAELPGSSPAFRAFFMSFNTTFCRFNCMAF